jgi:hypothetical protein
MTGYPRREFELGTSPIKVIPRYAAQCNFVLVRLNISDRLCRKETKSFIPMKRKLYILQTFCQKVANGNGSLSCTTEFNARRGCGSAAVWLLEHLGCLGLRRSISASYLHSKRSKSRYSVMGINSIIFLQ